jgi:predicted AlkP superfamily phosphohydrolase/phosphomutase
MVELIVLGIDGASFNVLDPLIKEGTLPNIKKMIDGGARGYLESTFMPVTGPAWTSLATGKNPGKTGVFDFFNRIKKDIYEMKPMTSTNIKQAGAYWDYLSEKGKKVCIFNYPMLYPPYPINGIMVSGLGSSPEDNITFPYELKKKLIDICGGYKIDIPFELKKYENNPLLFVAEALELLEINKKAIEYLLDLKPDIYTAVISATDFAQHYMWKFIDDTHTLYDINEAEKYKGSFVKIWQKTDEILGIIANKMTDKTNILIVSDHGFGPHNQSFYVNTWLENEGYLVWKKRIRLKLMKYITKKLERINIPYVNKIVSGKAIQSLSITNKINFKKTRAFANINSGAAGEIFINIPKELRFEGSDKYTIIRNQIINNLKDTCKRLNVTVDIYLPSEVYTGKYLELTPDILFVMNNHECEVNSGFSEKFFINTPPSKNHSGTHRKNGILIAYGPDIKSEKQIFNAKIYDIAPTILHMFDIPIPRDIDGRVLKDIFKEDSKFAKKEIQYMDNNEEKNKIKERIRKLKKIGKI